MFNGNFVRQAREIDPTSTGVKEKAGSDCSRWKRMPPI
jgi:hypothetical protein